MHKKQKSNASSAIVVDHNDIDTFIDDDDDDDVYIDADTVNNSKHPHPQSMDTDSEAELSFSGLPTNTLTATNHDTSTTVDDNDVTRKLLFTDKVTVKDSKTPFIKKYKSRVDPSVQPRAVRVICRFRPLLHDEILYELDDKLVKQHKLADKSLTQFQSYQLDPLNHAINCTAPKISSSHKSGTVKEKFTFTTVLPLNATQHDVYNETTKPLIDDFIHNNSNTLIFAYGVTRSGKTYTMEGSETQPGILPRVLHDIFDTYKQRNTTYVNEELYIQCSYLEIYEEKVYDLLSDECNDELNINDKPMKPTKSKLQSKQQKQRSLKALEIRNINVHSADIYVAGLSEHRVTDYNSALQLLHRGRELRSVGETKLNQHSSRSHSVFCIKLMSMVGDASMCYSKLSIVDLAGAESNKRAENNSKRANEANSINLGLSNLWECLRQLRNKQQLAATHKSTKSKQKDIIQIPVRNSALTSLFADNFNGYGSIVVIANASSSPLDYDETTTALQQASVANNIITESKIDTKAPISYKQAVRKSQVNNKKSSKQSIAGSKRSRDELDESSDDDDNTDDDDVDISDKDELIKSLRQQISALHDDVDEMTDVSLNTKHQSLMELQQRDTQYAADRTALIESFTQQLNELQSKNEQRRLNECNAIKQMYHTKLLIEKQRCADLQALVDEYEQQQSEDSDDDNTRHLSLPKPRISQSNEYQLLKSNYDRLQQQMTQQIDTQLQHHSMQLQLLQDELTQQSTLYTQLQAKYESDISELNQMLTVNAAQLDAHVIQYDRMKLQYDDMQDKNISLQATIDTMKQQSLSSKKGLSNSEQMVKTQLESMAKHEVELNKQIKRLNKEIEAVKNENIQYKQQSLMMGELHDKQINDKELLINALQQQIDNNKTVPLINTNKPINKKDNDTSRLINLGEPETDVAVLYAAAAHTKPSKPVVSISPVQSAAPVNDDDMQFDDMTASGDSMINTTADLIAMFRPIPQPTKPNTTTESHIHIAEQQRMDKLAVDERKKADAAKKAGLKRQEKLAKELVKQKKQQYDNDSISVFDFPSSPPALPVPVEKAVSKKNKRAGVVDYSSDSEHKQNENQSDNIDTQTTNKSTSRKKLAQRIDPVAPIEQEIKTTKNTLETRTPMVKRLRNRGS